VAQRVQPRPTHLGDRHAQLGGQVEDVADDVGTVQSALMKIS